MMTSKVQKWGNSQGLRFPKTLLEDAHLKVGDTVQMSVQGGKIIIEPLEQVRGKYDLQELVAKMPEGYQVKEVEWGNPVGEERW